MIGGESGWGNYRGGKQGLIVCRLAADSWLMADMGEQYIRGRAGRLSWGELYEFLNL